MKRRVLAYFKEGYSRKEIAYMVGLSLNHVCILIRARGVIIRNDYSKVQEELADYLPSLETGYIFLRPDSDKPLDNPGRSTGQKGAL